MATRSGVAGSGDRAALYLVAGAAAVCAALAAFLPPVPDHAYQFWMAERLLDGARMYVDVGAADMHPPLFTWSATALAALGRALGVPGLRIYPVLVALATLAALAAAWRLGLRAPLLLAAAAAALFPVAGPYFAQGEHLALLCALPYLVAAARAEERVPGSRTGRVAVALAAAFGLAMKPYFALVWVGVELSRARQRGARELLRLENLLIGGAFVLYVAATALFTPEFFGNLPWLAALYPRFAPVPFASLLLDPRLALILAGILAVRLAPLAGFERRLGDILSIAAAAMYVALLAQEKGWGYHWYPVVALAVVLLVLAARAYLSRARPLVAAALAAAALAWMPFQVARTEALLDAFPGHLTELAEVVERFGGDGAFVAYSHLLSAGFPVVNVTGASWTSPYGHLWMVPAMYRDAWAGRAPLRYGQEGRWRALEAEILERLWAEVEGQRPGLVLLERPQASGFSMRRWLELDARFAAWLADARTVARVGPYDVLRP
ncbi:MAG: hypothetical protein WEB88_00335 [Gemmatimonadota bacterium]